MSQERLQSNVWEDLINSGEYLSCLALRGRNGREERIDLLQKNQCSRRNSFRENNHVRIEKELRQGAGN